MKLLERIEAMCQRKHYSPKTAEAHVRWVRDYLRWHCERRGRRVDSRELRTAELEAYLTMLSVFYFRLHG